MKSNHSFHLFKQFTGFASRAAFSLTLIAAILSGCGPSSQDVQATINAAVIRTAGAQPTPTLTSTANATISFALSAPSGQVPNSRFYAVDMQSGAFTAMDLVAAPAGTLYSLQIPAGTYNFYARSLQDGDTTYFGLWDSPDGGLSAMPLQSGGKVTHLNLTPGSLCNPGNSLPASPDGKFPPTPAQPDPSVCQGTPGPTGILSFKFTAKTGQTPALRFYAVETQTGAFVTKDISAGPAETVYQVGLLPGVYVFYARALQPDDIDYFGAWHSLGGGLNALQVEAGQPVTDSPLPLSPGNPCDPIYSLPASPDGAFSATASYQGLAKCPGVTGSLATVNFSFKSDASRTPWMRVYFVNTLTNAYQLLELVSGATSAQYSIQLAPGDYNIYARSLQPNDNVYFGAWNNPGGWLAEINLKAGDAANVVLTPGNPCDLTLALPVSPDGKFPHTDAYKEKAGCAGENAADLATIYFQIQPEKGPLGVIFYAVEVNTGAYVRLAIDNAADGAVFSLDIPAGVYQFYARSTGPDDTSYFGLWNGPDGMLLTITIQPNQLLRGLLLTPPGDPCSPAYLLPASPDGVYPATSTYAGQFGCP